MAWNTACPDWEDRILAGRTLVPDLPLFEGEAARAVRIFNRLRIPDVIGKPTMAEAGTEWLLPIVRAICGAYDPATDRRMIQEFFWLVPKKNSKSSGAAAIMVTVLIVNRRPLAEALLVAPTKEIANIAYKQAWGIIQADPELAKLFHGQHHVRTITHRRTGASLQIKAADTDVITGSKATYTLIDETHVFAKKPRAADVFVEIRGALAARPDGFLIQVTTQSKDTPAGVFKQELETARRVRDGEMALPLLPILYELPARLTKDGGWKDRTLWPLVNPNMGRSVDEGFLANQLTKADQEGPEALALLASQHFNVEIGMGLRANRWPGAEFWERAAEPEGLTLDDLLHRSEVICIGIDGGGLDDLFGLAVVGRDSVTRDWLAWTHAWAHKGVLERRKSIATKLREFEAAGEMTIVADELDDISAIVAIAERVKDAGLLACIGVDPAGLGELIEAFAEVGITQDEKLLIGVSQGYGLMNAIKTAERKLASGTLRHSGSGLAAWCASNLKIEPTATAIRATKQNAGDAKIDVAMALFNAVALMATNPEPAEISDPSDFLREPLFA
ncbi:terminase large subunit [Methylorubrum salsuginis]|uniref:Phage terminase-like protein, large subunit, contains N-terminal HTH domain n=1 Tax=Methylorubrum salsuginis TaxID=414703 RepID=A0A1I4FK92_9HYPH|nr:terminase TerL endonuclease subunit [Methylorubrum salsuginis]SFL18334.1 Phage terminase-like protein, large subunit, contains N-terminal HTH domain [Methylorubrum salsuginis]